MFQFFHDTISWAKCRNFRFKSFLSLVSLLTKMMIPRKGVYPPLGPGQTNHLLRLPSPRLNRVQEKTVSLMYEIGYCCIQRPTTNSINSVAQWSECLSRNPKGAGSKPSWVEYVI
uniref:Uncharacterized protein n=1 Tax=Cacopsylla melanoneura TaxID=428564 RepID=A0A8D8YZE5_9HEMI